MTEQGAQYDHIGSKYDAYARTATLKRAERYTFFRMVGALHGQRVLDLACGFGFYTRLLKQQGAATVVGVDISPEMIRLATQQEQAEPLGITYQVGDAVALPQVAPSIWSPRPICSTTREQGPDARDVPQRLQQLGGGRALHRLHQQPSVHPQQAKLHEVRRHRAPPSARGGPVCLRGRGSHRSSVPSGGTSGARPRMSGRSRRPGSGTSPGTPRRWHRKTWRTTGKRIGVISTTIAS